MPSKPQPQPQGSPPPTHLPSGALILHNHLASKPDAPSIAHVITRAYREAPGPAGYVYRKIYPPDETTWSITMEQQMEEHAEALFLVVRNPNRDMRPVAFAKVGVPSTAARPVHFWRPSAMGMQDAAVFAAVGDALKGVREAVMGVTGHICPS